MELIGEAASFSETLELTSLLKPDILVVDLYMPDEREYPPETIKIQALLSVDCILAVSVSIDDDARALAKSFGARALLDKANLYSALIPAIKL
jgi:DNA-binding NarL/FixJ family response regulator